MTGNIVKLVFESVARGSGVSRMATDIDAMRKNLGFASGAAKLLGRTIGGIGGVIGGTVGALLRGNLWELGAIAAGKLVSVIKNHNQLMKDAALAARGLSREYMTLEKAAEGYQKRVEEWRKAKEESDKADAEAAKAREAAAEAAKRTEQERLSFEQKYYELEKQIATEISERESMGEDELTVLKKKFDLVRKIADMEVEQAKRNLDSARKTGGGSAVDIAEKELQLAQERQKTAYKKSNQLVDEYSKKQDAKLDEAAERKQKKEEEAAAKRKREEEKKASEARKKEINELKKHIEEESRKRDDLEGALAEAVERANAAHDVLGNAANMDQAGDLADKRREAINENRYQKGADDLMKSGKIRRGANGEWVANGRLSNMNQAILERMNADQNKEKLEKENDNVVKKLDELIKKLEQMSTL